MNSRCRGSGILMTNHHTTNQMAVGFWCLASGHPEVIVFQDYQSWKSELSASQQPLTFWHLHFLDIKQPYSCLVSFFWRSPNSLTPCPESFSRANLNTCTSRACIKDMSGKADRPSKRVRRLSTDSEGSSASYDWTDRRKGGTSGRADRSASGHHV
jgi:hypothetical protein